MSDGYMPTYQLRWVKRAVPAPEVAPNIAKEVTVLQQRWDNIYVGGGSSEWRDVPIVEDET